MESGLVNLSPAVKVTLASFAALFMTGCELIADIFAAGFWVGAIVVLVIVFIVVLVVRMLR